MIEHIRTLQEALNSLQIGLRKIRSKQIHHKKIIAASKKIVDIYFRELREFLLSACNNTSVITDLDANMQDLLEATHKKTSIGIYKSRVSKIKNLLLETEKLILLSASNSNNRHQLTPADRRVIETLKKILPSAALSYEQALIDMESSHRLSWRGPATDLREALRECLDHLAPDKEVEDAPGFKREPNANGPTMKQKTTYILRSRQLSKESIKSAQDSVALIDEMLGSFVRSIYTRASISTHTPTDKKEVGRICDLVRFVLCELLSIS
jgi:hypothetical protein